MSGVGAPPVTSSSQFPIRSSTTEVPPYSAYTEASRTSTYQSRLVAASPTTSMCVSDFASNRSMLRTVPATESRQRGPPAQSTRRRISVSVYSSALTSAAPTTAARGPSRWDPSWTCSYSADHGRVQEARWRLEHVRGRLSPADERPPGRRCNRPSGAGQRVLLCSEDKPHHCHRRLVAEYLQSRWDDVHVGPLGRPPSHGHADPTQSFRRGRVRRGGPQRHGPRAGPRSHRSAPPGRAARGRGAVSVMSSRAAGAVVMVGWQGGTGRR